MMVREKGEKDKSYNNFKCTVKNTLNNSKKEKKIKKKKATSHSCSKNWCESIEFSTKK